MNCRTYGWGVWGVKAKDKKGKKSSSPFQAFSTPAKLVDGMFCSDAVKSGSVMRKNDLCYANKKTKVCSMVSMTKKNQRKNS